MPSGTPPMVGAVRVMPPIAGVIWPFGEKVKSVLTFCQATSVPVALELTW